MRVEIREGELDIYMAGVLRLHPTATYKIVENKGDTIVLDVDISVENFTM